MNLSQFQVRPNITGCPLVGATIVSNEVIIWKTSGETKPTNIIFYQWDLLHSCPVCEQVKESQQMKVVFSEQLNKLQTKQHLDTELLEEIRSDTLSVS